MVKRRPGSNFRAFIKNEKRLLAEVAREYPRRIAAEMRTALDRFAFRFEGEARSTLFRGEEGGVQGRTGNLSRSIGHTKPRGTTIGTVGYKQFIGNRRIPYARVQEEGGILKSSRPGGYLTIPLQDNLTGRGVPRYKSARDLFERRPDDVFITKTKTGRLLIGLDDKGGTKWLWVLKKKVRLKPRLGFVKLFRSKRVKAARRE
jgi:hypothetical protein